MHDHVVIKIREDLPRENMIYCKSDDMVTFTDSLNNKYNVTIPMEGLLPEWDECERQWYWVETPGIQR